VEHSSIELQVTWPRYAMLVCGRLYPLETLERHIDESEFGCSALMNWPSADCQNYRDGTALRKEQKGSHAVEGRNWPTMSTNEAKNSAGKSQLTRNTPPLGQPRYWPTVCHTEVRQGFQDRSRGMKGTQESLTTVVMKDGLQDQAKANTNGNRQELLASARPTPKAGNPGSRPNGKGGKILNEEVKKHWMTPTKEGFDAQGHRGNLDTLHSQMKAWATPTADDANNATRDSGQFQSLTRQAGKLNPHWVACLMGYPPLWCELGRKFTTASANSKGTGTPSSRKSRKSLPAQSSST
jgi:hypothetical protein